MVQRCGLSIHKTSELGIKRYGDDEVSSVNDSITSFFLESMDGKVSVRVNSRVSESLGDTRWRSLTSEQKKLASDKGVTLHDDESKPVDLLLGLPYYRRLVLGSEVPLNDDLVAKRTKIGWVVYGGAIEPVSGVATGSVVQTTPALEELFQQLDGAHESPPEALAYETFNRRGITHTGERY